MSNQFGTVKGSILTFALLETALLILSSLLWFIQKTLTLANYSDKLFVISTVAFCLGAIVAITSNSRKHYYKHIQEKTKGVSGADEKYEVGQDNRKRYAQYGMMLGGSGIFGIVISGVILFL